LAQSTVWADIHRLDQRDMEGPEDQTAADAMIQEGPGMLGIVRQY
jgi:hypothetical protein